jgi:2-isopropylmalate synthase
VSAPVPRPAGPFVPAGSVRIFDTTLRDGEQAPGAGLTAAEKLEVARQLARLKVDVIEAGFPAASPGDFEAVRRIAMETPQDIAVAALARCRDGDPQRAIEAIKVAHKPHLHVFIATSDIHLKHKLRVDRETALAEAVRWVRYGREQLGRDAEIEFSAEDASRTDTDFLLKVYEAVVEAGASTVNVPDTVGYAIPSEFGELTRKVVDLVGNQATVSIHCHNDLGLATANTLAAVQAGARQVEVTINGLGERAGNASLEEVVMALRTRPTQFQAIGSGIATEHITAASRLVSYLTGFAVQPNKAIVGGNAFAHESGIHQDGVIKNPLTYEIMTPQSVGLTGSQLTIGKLSGRRGLQGKLRELGHDLEGEALDAIYRQAIELADAKKEVTDADLLALVEQRSAEVPASVELVGWSVTSSHGGNATGTVTVAIEGRERATEATGNGPVNALFSAVDEALQPVLGWHPILTEYEIKAVSAGEDAQGQVLVRCRRSSDEGPGALVVSGHGLSTNIIEASLDAYLVATNKLHGAEINGVAVAFANQRTERGLP